MALGKVAPFMPESQSCLVFAIRHSARSSSACLRAMSSCCRGVVQLRQHIDPILLIP